MASNRWLRWIVGAGALAALTIASSPGSRNVSATTRYIGSDHIVSWTPLPEEMGAMCPMPDMTSSPAPETAASYQFRNQGTNQGATEGVPTFAQPDRVVRDRYPSFSSIAVDLTRDQVVVTDENLFQVLFYRRTENNGPNQVARPKRVIGTKWDQALMKHEETKTHIEFQCGLYIDQRNGDVY